MFINFRWWDASFALWIFDKLTTCFMESLHFFKHNFYLVPRWNINWPRWICIFFYISRLKSLNLVLIPGANWMTTGALGQGVLNLYTTPMRPTIFYCSSAIFNMCYAKSVQPEIVADNIIVYYACTTWFTLHSYNLI